MNLAMYLVAAAVIGWIATELMQDQTRLAAPLQPWEPPADVS